MLSRSIRLISQLTNTRIHAVNAVRNHGDVWVYRAATPRAERWRFLAADTLSAVTWWWILIHLYYQPGHVFGEYPYPEPEKWKDEELGIPQE
ncbi:hypothetical protein JTE90_016284 [Oedothorax gibbosus]|uniref:NADH dehydrogenase [ubiquinone] 1 beta subcomplex subunit 2, mitochondrial n=1 Tax=Oedothorax gibbosus TaxID=931172 RepID=A0AAV6U3U8_9ARAC|nr:hypothetical protein JTE90_016284 [Oedothorax gibbosus]